jgi:hypothetical protein
MTLLAKLKKKRLAKKWKKSYGKYQIARDEYQSFMKNNPNQTDPKAIAEAKRLKEIQNRLYKESNALQDQR